MVEVAPGVANVSARSYLNYNPQKITCREEESLEGVQVAPSVADLKLKLPPPPQNIPCREEESLEVVQAVPSMGGTPAVEVRMPLPKLRERIIKVGGGAC